VRRLGVILLLALPLFHFLLSEKAHKSVVLHFKIFVEHLSLMLDVMLRNMKAKSWDLGHFIVFYLNAILCRLSSNCVLRSVHRRHASHHQRSVMILHSNWFIIAVVLLLMIFREVTRLNVKRFTFADLWCD
jgi:hypothetical protein